MLGLGGIVELSPGSSTSARYSSILVPFTGQTNNKAPRLTAKK